jgi:hypothetical protein
MATNDVSTPATTHRSVKAACERMATAKLAPGLFLVDNGKRGDEHDQYVVEPDLPACTCADWEYRSEDLGDDGCKHIRRVRMVRGEIDLEPLLKSDAQVDDVLLRNLGVRR